MFPLSEIILTSRPEYFAYLSKKTGFLLPDSGRDQQLQWFWIHLVHLVQEKNKIESLTLEESAAFDELLVHFGSMPAVRHEYAVLEEKLACVFKHPGGGYFIPLEIFKLLMQRYDLSARNYLFTLLFSLAHREQRSLVSMISSSLEGQAVVSFESHPLDMALVLYIWFANHHVSGNLTYPDRGVMLHSPYAFVRETASIPVHEREPGYFPETPVSMWEHLRRYFPHRERDAQEWKNLMVAGGKGFYRGLSLISNTRSELFQAFRNGYFFPVMKKQLADKRSVEEIQIVTPREIFFQNEKSKKEKLERLSKKADT